VLLLLLLCSVCCCVNDTSRAKKKRATSVSSSRSRHEDDYFFFWCVRTEFGKPSSIGPSDGSDSFKGKIRGEKKFFLCFGRWYFFTSTAQLAFPHTHTHAVIFSKGTVTNFFVSGEENTAGRVFTVALARFDSRHAPRSRRRFRASLLFLCSLRRLR